MFLLCHNVITKTQIPFRTPQSCQLLRTVSYRPTGFLMPVKYDVTLCECYRAGSKASDSWVLIYFQSIYHVIIIRPGESIKFIIGYNRDQLTPINRLILEIDDQSMKENFMTFNMIDTNQCKRVLLVTIDWSSIALYIPLVIN